VGYLLRRPPRRDFQAQLYDGVFYIRQARSSPRSLLIHTVEIDLTVPTIDFLVTPGDEHRRREAPARKTSEFLREFGVQLAINGSFFEPFRERAPWSYYPRRGQYVTVKGLAISDSWRYADEEPAYPAFCISPLGAEIRLEGCHEATRQALAGNHLLLRAGQVVADRLDQALHPRTAVAVSQDGLKVWLVVVDGRQPWYSEGMTLGELADYLVELGAEWGLNLDGGGSSTLVAVDPATGRPRLLNSPIHTRIPLRQRPVANHLGIFAGRREP
jgi:hypothetical protein